MQATTTRARLDTAEAMHFTTRRRYQFERLQGT
jgi:hypothetical protein